MAPRFTAVAVAIAATLACTSPALAATPFTAGTGAGHDIAVGLDGTAHVAWFTDEADDERIGYCRVPAGGSACDGESGFLNFPDASTTADAKGSVQIFAPAANQVLIYATCTQCPTGDPGDNTYRLASANNGADFTPTAGVVGELAFSGQGSYISSGNILLGVAGSRFQAMASALAPINLGGAGFFFSASAVPGASDEAVYAVDNLDAVKYRVFTGTRTATNLNTLANWSADQALPAAEADNEETQLSSGGSGVKLIYLSTFSPGDARVGLRSFNSTTNTFGSPTYIQGSSAVDGNALNFPHHSQSAGNRIHVVWRTLHDGGRLRYIRSDDGGATFSAPANLALRESFQDPLVEAGPASTGFAAWRSGSTIRVVPIDPQPEPSSPGGGTPGGGTPGGGTDTMAPGVTGFGIGDRTLTPGQGTSFTFNSSEAGLAVLIVQKRVKGLKLKKGSRLRCFVQTKKRLRKLRRSLARRPAVRRLTGRARRRKLARLVRKRGCKPYKKIGEIRRPVVAGRNTIAFKGRIAGRRLGPGTYRARLTVTDSAGNVSSLETVTFRVVGKKAR
jgi:hypothetical protein